MAKIIFSIDGMTCVVCSRTCEKAISKLDGVLTCNVNFASGKANVEYDESIVEPQAIFDAVTRAGYKVHIKESKKDKQLPIVIIKLVCAIVLMIFAMGHMIGLPYPAFLSPSQNPIVFCIVQIVLCIPVIVLGFDFYVRGFANLFKAKPNMDSLVAVSTTTAFLYSLYSFVMICLGNEGYVHNLYFESVAVIIAVLSLGKYLESKSLKKTGEAIRSLTMLTPTYATIKLDGQWQKVESKQVKIGDIVLVKTGESFCCDGKIIEGECSIDESMLTGESLPVDKKTGDVVVGGTVNTNGVVQFVSTGVGEDTALAKIIRLVEEAQNSKAPIARLADKVSGVFVPVVMAIAILAGIIWTIALGSSFAIKIFVGVLVIACPCALGLATPTAIIAGIGRGAKEGILYRNAQALEELANIDTVVFDKTGTLTLGKPKVVDYIFDGDSQKILAYAMAIESMSMHPLAQAVVNYAQSHNISDIVDIKDMAEVSGKGLKALIEGENVICGNGDFLRSNNINTDVFAQKEMEFLQKGYSLVFLAIEKKAKALFAIADVLKDNAKSSVQELKNNSIDVVLLSGDNKLVAENIARSVGIEHTIAQVLPEEKANEIDKLISQGKKVAMVGDGINDAPALAKANVGIAMGNGSDIAIESGQVVLVGGQTESVGKSILLAKATMRNVKQNLFWAFIYNIIGIPIACGVLYPAFGYVMNPMLGGIAMSLSSICVVANALRLNAFRFGKKNKQNQKYTQNAQNENNCQASCCLNSNLEDMRVQKEQEVLQMQNTSINQISNQENTIQSEVQSMKLKVNGMMCMHCENRVNKVVGAIEGVSKVIANHNENCVEVEFDGNMVNLEDIKKAIRDEGYEVE